MTQSYSVAALFFGFDRSWRNDAFVIDERTLDLSVLLGQLAHLNVAAQFVNLVFYVGKEVGRVPLSEERDDLIGQRGSWGMGQGDYGDVELRQLFLKDDTCQWAGRSCHNWEYKKP